MDDARFVDRHAVHAKVRLPPSKAVVMSDDRDRRDYDDWAEWPEPEVDVDDEVFAAAIAKGRELEEAA